MTNDTKLVLRVAAKAVIVNNDGKVLIVRESAKDQENTMVGLYGLVGGRLEAGETFIDGLHREVFEEVGLEIEPIRPIEVGEWHPVIKGVPHQIIAVFMLCKPITNIVVLSPEHDKYVWASKDELKNYKIMGEEKHVLDTLFDMIKHN